MHPTPGNPNFQKITALLLLAPTFFGSLSSLAAAQGADDDRIKKLEDEFKAYRERTERENADLRREITQLKQQSASAPGAPASRALEDAIAELQVRVTGLTSRQGDFERTRGQRTAFLDMSLDILTNIGTSEATDDEIPLLQLGHHDPAQRGFTLSNMELQLEGAVDPYFRGTAVMAMVIDAEGETVLEAEEAYLTTTQLPADLQLKAGVYFTEFGRLNRQHAHTWEFVDQPIVLGRYFGGDGLRGPGARASWLAPVPFFLEFQSGVQNPRGETQTSFIGNEEVWPGITGSSGDEVPGSGGGFPFRKGTVDNLGDMLLTERVSTSLDLTDESSFVLGGSALFGPNSTGEDGRTQIYGVDFYYRWRPTDNYQGFPFVSFQTEAMWRNYRADSFFGDIDDDGTNEAFPSRRFRDFGSYAQMLWGITRPWVAGARAEYVDGNGLATGGNGSLDRRIRYALNLTYYPTEFSRIRLQGNWDRIQELNDNSYFSVWLQFEILFGAHAPHRF